MLFLLVALAAYLLFIGLMLETKNFRSALIFNYIPLVLAFLAGCAAFSIYKGI
jgi:hypothetical protein